MSFISYLLTFQVFDNYWDGFVDETCREQMPKAAACLYGELGELSVCHLRKILSFNSFKLWFGTNAKVLAHS